MDSMICLCMTPGASGSVSDAFGDSAGHKGKYGEEAFLICVPNFCNSIGGYSYVTF